MTAIVSALRTRSPLRSRLGGAIAVVLAVALLIDPYQSILLGYGLVMPSRCSASTS